MMKALLAAVVAVALAGCKPFWLTDPPDPQLVVVTPDPPKRAPECSTADDPKVVRRDTRRDWYLDDELRKSNANERALDDVLKKRRVCDAGQTADASRGGTWP